MPNDKNIGTYIEQASKFPLLTHKQELVLGKRIADGDKAAITKMVNHNLRLVINIAKQFYKNIEHLSYLDVIQEGNIGLIHAAKRFDYTKGYRFSSYATKCIRQHILRGIVGQCNAIRIPEHKYFEADVEHAPMYSTDSNSPDSTLDRIEERLGFGLDRVDDPAYRIEFWQRLGDCIHFYLNRRAGYIINARLGIRWQRKRGSWSVRFTYPLKLETVGAQLSLSRERVRQIQNESFEKISSVLIREYRGENCLREAVLG